MTRGPSLHPAERRLAVQVEDHPLEYGTFEGTIPKGQYGGGTVLLWDRGSWQPQGDPARDYRAGKLKFRLFGDKLHGGWMLLRLKPRGARGRSTRDNWLLIKERDAAARDSGDILAEQPNSTLSGRSLDEIAQAAEHPTASKPRRAKPQRASRGRAPSPPKTASTSTVAPSVASVRISHPDRGLPGEPALTKLDLAEYYAAIAPRMLPDLINRPLSLLRCPGGGEQGCFFQKHIKADLPAVRQIAIREKAVTRNYSVIDDVQGLVALVQYGVIEFHPWGSRADDIERPDRLIFDLDPDPALAWSAVAGAARELRDRLAAHKLRSFLKTTGGKGLHVVVPLVPAAGWADAKAFAHAIAGDMVADAPDRFVATMTKAKRTDRIFIDFFRNDRGATAVAAYSTRARAGIPIAIPLAWDALTPRLRPDRFNLRTIARRLTRLDDPWAEMPKIRQTLPGSRAVSRPAKRRARDSCRA